MSESKKSKKQIRQIEENLRIIQRYWSEITIFIVILIIAIIRYRLIGVPLERDEGEYAYMGQLLLQGIPPYAGAYSMKFPGIYFVYALVLAIFGHTHTGIHLALLFMNAATIFFIYLLGKNLFDTLTGTLSGTGYGILSLCPKFHGPWANSEHFVLFFAVGGILLLIKGINSDKAHLFFLSGILFGLSFTTKQHGVFFTLFGFGYFIIIYLKESTGSLPDFRKKIGLFILGVIIPGGLFLLILAIGGALDKFWFWTFKYASEYASMLSIESGLLNLKANITPGLKMSFPIWLSAVIGLTSLFWDKKSRSRWLFSSGFFLASLAALSLGFYFRKHYFIFLFPSLSLLSGIAIASLSRLIFRFSSQAVKTGTIVIISFAVYSYPLLAQRDFLFKLTPPELSRIIYTGNPFPESLVIAKYLRQNTSINDRIAVLGSEPQICFYANRRSATGYIYMYAMMEVHPFALEMQKEMIREVEAAEPKYLVFVGVSTSWLRGPQSHSLIFDWLSSYLSKHYEIAIVTDIYPNRTLYTLGDKAKKYEPRSNCYLLTYKRKT